MTIHITNSLKIWVLILCTLVIFFMVMHLDTIAKYYRIGMDEQTPNTLVVIATILEYLAILIQGWIMMLGVIAFIVIFATSAGLNIIALPDNVINKDSFIIDNKDKTVKVHTVPENVESIKQEEQSND